MIEKINIRQLKDDVNIILYENFNSDIKTLMISNEWCENIGGVLNEIIDSVNILL